MKKLLLFLMLFTSVCFSGWEVVEDEMRLLSPDGSELMRIFRDIDNTDVFINWTLGDLFMQGGNVNLEINDLTTTGTITSNAYTDGVLTITGGDITDVDHLVYDTTPSAIAHTEGLTCWSPEFFTTNIHTGLGATLQVGQELYTIVTNNSGADIPDGKIVQITGLFGGYPSVSLAIADTHEDIQGAIRVTTTAIPDGEIGVVALFGRVNDIDTSAAPFAGATLWISPDDAGEVVFARPSFPDYAFNVGAVEVKDAVNGVLSIQINSSFTDTLQNFWNGTLRETFQFRITESGGTVTGTLTPENGHPDMTMMFSDGFTILDTDPGATVDLTPFVSADTTVSEVFVYIPQTTKVLTASGSDWPTMEHVKVAVLGLQTAALTGTDGALRNQNWNDHIESTVNFQGHLSHIGERIRAIVAEWHTGAEATIGTGGQFISITEGKVYQMHLQTYPASSMPTDDLHIINDPDTPYSTTTDLDTILKDSTGANLSNAKFYSLVVWGVCNKSDEPSHLMLNLPSGSYNSETGAMSDSLGFANYTIPREFKGVGFLIARFVMRFDNPGWTYAGVSTGYQDLRGFIPNSTAGSGAGGSGITTLLGLTDTPASYIADKLVKVNAAGTAIEFDNTIVGNYAWGGGAATWDTTDGGTDAQTKFVTITTGGLQFLDAATHNWLTMDPFGNTIQFGGINDNQDFEFIGSGTAIFGEIIEQMNGTNTLAAAVTTFAIDSNIMTITGDGGGNTIATITGPANATNLTLVFVDANITITDDNTHAADSVDLSAAFTSADDTTLQLVYNGTSWYETGRSTN